MEELEGARAAHAVANAARPGESLGAAVAGGVRDFGQALTNTLNSLLGDRSAAEADDLEERQLQEAIRASMEDT